MPVLRTPSPHQANTSVRSFTMDSVQASHWNRSKSMDKSPSAPKRSNRAANSPSGEGEQGSTSCFHTARAARPRRHRGMDAMM